MENFEKLPVITKTITIEDLIDLIYKGQSLPQDGRFLPVEKGGVFKYFNVSELDDNSDKFYSLVFSEDIVVGLSELEVNPNSANSLWIKFISVDPKYQGQGYASKLIDEICKFAQEKGFSLEASAYSVDGEQKLKSRLIQETSKFGIEFLDTERKI